MTKVFFYGNIFVNDESSGITKKVLSQVSTLRCMGYSVYFMGYTNDGVAVFNNDNEIVKHVKYWTKSKKMNRYLRRWNLLHTAKKFISDTNEEFKYAYLRFHFFDRAYLKLLHELKKSGTDVIVEAHSYPYRNKKPSIFSPIHFLDMIYEPLIRKYIDLVAAISNHDNIWGCKTVQIDNAINLNDIKLQQKEFIKDKKIRLISVSNEREYHGYPKLMRGLAKYYKEGGDREIEINLVGGFKTSTKKLVNALGLNKYVHFHGKKYGEELIDLYNRSDLGIGALSSKAGSEYGSSIKTKEYFAIGLPFINGWKEYAFDDSYPYVKRFNLHDDKIDFEKVVGFFDSIKNDKEMSARMREFAAKNYTWDAQFKKVFKDLI